MEARRLDAQLKKGLLDVCVLSVLREGESYGYKIISDVAPYIAISESTLYPILLRVDALSHPEAAGERGRGDDEERRGQREASEVLPHHAEGHGAHLRVCGGRKGIREDL